jgi:hypothetical protein
MLLYLYKEDFRLPNKAATFVPCEMQPQFFHVVVSVTAVQAAGIPMSHHGHKQAVRRAVVFTRRYK